MYFVNYKLRNTWLDKCLKSLVSGDPSVRDMVTVTNTVKTWRPAPLLYTAQKTMFSFSKSFEKMAFPKKLQWNMVFLVLSGKMKFLFPENMTLFFGDKKKLAPQHDLLC